MLNSSNLATTAAVTVIVAFGIYRRVRRNIGRQTLTAGRQIFRMAFFTLLCGALAFLHPLQPVAAAYMVSGLLIGAWLGWFALRNTAFTATPEGYFYTPHLYIGIAVTALLIGRVLYGMALRFGMGPGYDTAAGSAATPMPANSPLTLGILFLTASYYIVYCTGLLRWLRKARRSAGARLPPGAPDGASSTSV